MNSMKDRNPRTKPEKIVLDGVGLAHFNWRSNPDLHTLFYNRLGIPVIRKQGRPTVNSRSSGKDGGVHRC